MPTLKTIKDLAIAADCSQSTVSKALNGRPDVSEKTRKKILKLAEDYDFFPSAIGRSLKRKKTENVGVIFCRESQPLSGNPFYSRVLEGIEAELAINNYNLILHLLPDSDNFRLPKMLREKQVDGLILMGVIKQNFNTSLMIDKLPIVLVDPKILIKDFNQVLIDNEYSAFQATKYLIQNGHQRIGFISGDLDRLSFKKRYDGYRKALEYYKIVFDEELVQTGGLEKGYNHVMKLLELKNKPTAIFAANDINAIYGYKALRDLNYKIPEDMSFIGFDDIELSKMSNPPLTTIRVYKEELGSIAVRQLLNTIQNPQEKPTTVVVPTKLIERESVKNLNPQCCSL